MSDALPAGLAAYLLVCAWRESPLPLAALRRLRQRAEVARDSGSRWGELLTCPVCLGAWVGALLWLLTQAPVVPYGVHALAAGGLAAALSRLTGVRS